MKKITIEEVTKAKEFVKKHYPNAKSISKLIESEQVVTITDGSGRVLSDEESESMAWLDAQRFVTKEEWTKTQEFSIRAELDTTEREIEFAKKNNSNFTGLIDEKQKLEARLEELKKGLKVY